MASFCLSYIHYIYNDDKDIIIIYTQILPINHSILPTHIFFLHTILHTLVDISYFQSWRHILYLFNIYSVILLSCYFADYKLLLMRRRFEIVFNLGIEYSLCHFLVYKIFNVIFLGNMFHFFNIFNSIHVFS